MTEDVSSKEVLHLTDAALAFIEEARSSEDAAEELSLFLEVNGVSNGSYTYDMWFENLADAGPGDAVEHKANLAVVVVESSVERVRGSTLDVGENGLFIVNPNAPIPEPLAFEIPESDLSSPLELAVLEVLEEQVNPQIAMHGGRADLVAVDGEGVAFLRLSGGCQGCGLAQLTLSQGISVILKEALPDITEVVDVTAHGEGTNPYFESAKK